MQESYDIYESTNALQLELLTDLSSQLRDLLREMSQLNDKWFHFFGLKWTIIDWFLLFWDMMVLSCDNYLHS
jgi:hypothetical protein